MVDFPKNPTDGIDQGLNATYNLRSLNERSAFLVEDQLYFYAKNSIFSQKRPKFRFFRISEQICVTRYCPKRLNL